MPKLKTIILLVCYMVFSSQVYSEPQVVADGLAIELLESLDITYQIVPDYDDTENVIVGWNGDEFQYFIAFSKLPPGWLDADVWIAGFIRDINAASERDTVRILDRGSNKSQGGYDLTYIKISFTPKGEQEPQIQLIHFITDQKSSYLAFATPVSVDGESKLGTEVMSILQTSRSPASNVTPLIRKNEDRFFGVWVGGYEDKLKGHVEVIFELKPDLTFTRKEVVEGEKDSVYSGVWSISNNVLSWIYLYGKPTSQESKSLEEDEISSFTGDAMVLISKGLQSKIVLQRAQ
ncbi:hypothetical protein [Amphritea sp.]|uniref:hypothetical protein n=1 Tax=Amphritea sp. TaxID=1872502 RepID=UPI003D0A5516